MQILFILLLVLSPVSMEVQTEMQQKDWVDTTVNVTGTLGQCSILKVGVYYYVASYTDGTTTITYNVDRYDANWANKTNLFTHQDAITTANYRLLKPHISYYYGNLGAGNAEHFFASFAYTKIAADQDTQVISDLYDITNSNDLGGLDATQADDDFRKLATIGQTGYYIIYRGADAHADTDTIEVAGGMETISGMGSKAFAVNATNMRYLLYDGSDVLIRNDEVGVAFTTYETLVEDEGDDLDLDTGQYWEYGDIRIAVWVDHLYIDFGDDVWQPYSVTGTPVLHWEISSNVVRLAAVTIGDTYVEYDFDRDQILVFQTATQPTGTTGWKDVLIDASGNIYMLELATVSGYKTATVGGVVMQEPKEITINTNQEPITNQMYRLYNDSDVLRYTGRLQTYKDKYGLYEIILLCPIWADLEIEITYDPDGDTADVILKDILDTYCNWLTYGASTIDDTVTKTYSEPWTSKRIGNIIQEIAKSEGMWFWYDEGDMELYLQQGVASGLTVVDTSDGITFPSDPIEKIPLPKSNFELVGRWNPTTSSRYTVSSIIDAAAIPYYDEFPNADDTELAAILTNLKALVNLSLTIVRLGIYNKALVLGDSFALTLAKWSIAADTYYVQEIHENLLANTIQIVATSAISIPKISESQSTKNAIANVKENIDQTNKTVSTYIYQETQDDYKNKFADRWGTSGDPLLWTRNDTNANTVSSVYNGTLDGHAYPLEQYDNDADAADRCQVYREFSAIAEGYFSLWVRKTSVANVSNAGFRSYNGAGTVTNLSFYNAGIQYYTAGTGSIVVFPNAIANEWYHVFVYFYSTGFDIYVNGDLCGVNLPFQTAIGAGITGFLFETAAATQIHYAYYDAFYIGTSWKAAWSSAEESLVMNDQLYTAYGKRGWHYLGFKDNNFWDYSGTSATNGGTVVLNWITGTSTETNVTQVTDVTTKIPANAKSLHIIVYCSADTVNTGNYLMFKKNGNTNDYDGLRAYNGAVANFLQPASGVIDLDSSGNLIGKVVRAAGTLTFHIKIIGYFV